MIRLTTLRNLQASEESIKNFEELKASIFNSSSSSILACLQTPISVQRIKKQIETIYINAMKRVWGFKIIAQLSQMRHSTETKAEYLNWFCSSLRHNTNVLSHYTDDVTGWGEHLKNELRKSFFLVFNGIIKQIGEWTNETEIKFMLNWCKWQFTASDHEDLIKSGIFEILSQGNGKKEKDKNPLKYCWGSNFSYECREDYPLCQDVLEIFEQILVACFARIIKKDSGEEQKIKTNGTSVPGMEKAHSLVNTSTTEGLITKGLKHIFEQLDRYIKLIKKFDGIDWEFYVSKRNSQRKNGERIAEAEGNCLEDDQEIQSEGDSETNNEPIQTGNQEESKEAQDFNEDEEVFSGGSSEDTSSSPSESDESESDNSGNEDSSIRHRSIHRESEHNSIRSQQNANENDNGNEDIIKNTIKQKEDQEIEKLKKFYEDKFIMRFLRLIETFTSIATNKKEIRQMVFNVATSKELTILVDLLVHGPPRHGYSVLKIFSNLFKIRLPGHIFDESVKWLSQIDGSLHQKIMNNIKCQNKFDSTPFLKFLFHYTVSIRSAMWNDSHFEGSGSFILSNMMLGLLRTILSSDAYPKYQKELVSAIDHLIDHIDTYALEEFEPLISVLNGAEYLGLGLGANGVWTDGSMFTVLGFAKKWYGLKTQDNQNDDQNDDEFVKHRIQTHLENKNDHILALYYDPKHPERTDIFTAIPEEVRLIPKLEKETNKILLDETRINKYLKALKLDEKFDKSDYVNSTKRSLGLKILEQYLVDHGEELIKLIDPEFYNSFLKLLYSEACSPNSGKSTMQNDWIEQKIHALQEYAVENNASLRTSNNVKVRFIGKNMFVTKVLKSAGNQTFCKCIDLVSAMNYGRVVQGENYSILNAAGLPEKDEDLSKIEEKDLRLIDPTEVPTVDLLYKHLKTAKILLSWDVDIGSMHKELVKKDLEIAYFKSIMIVSKEDFIEIKQFLNEDPIVKAVKVEGKSQNDALIQELVEFGGFDENQLKEILKGNEDATISRKSNLISEWWIKQEEKIKLEENKTNNQESKEETKNSLHEETIDTFTSQGIENNNSEKDNKQNLEDKNAFDEDTIFNLEKNDKFTQILESVSKYGSSNYEDQSNKPKKQRGDLLNSVYIINNRNIEGDYLSWIGNYFVSMCRKTIMSFFKISQIENLLRLTLSSKDSTENFIKFVKIIGNELIMTKLNMIDDKPYEDLKKILGSIIKSCVSNKDFTPFLHQLFRDVIVKGSIKGLKTVLEAGAKDVKSYFNNESVAIETMNFYILVDIVSLYIKEWPDLIFEDSDLFKKFMTMLFLIPCVFRGDSKLQKNVYLSILKIVVIVDQSIGKLVIL